MPPVADREALCPFGARPGTRPLDPSAMPQPSRESSRHRRADPDRRQDSARRPLRARARGQFDRPTATGLKVDEQRTVLRVEHVPGCGSPCRSCSAAPRSAIVRPRLSRAPAQEIPVSVGERRRLVAVGDELLSLRDSVGEVRRRDIELAHAGMQPPERMRVAGGRDLPTRQGSDSMSTQGDGEAVTLVDERRRSRLESGDRAPGLGEPLSKLDFEPRDVPPQRCEPGRGRHTAAGAPSACSSLAMMSSCSTTYVLLDSNSSPSGCCLAMFLARVSPVGAGGRSVRDRACSEGSPRPAVLWQLLSREWSPERLRA